MSSYNSSLSHSPAGDKLSREYCILTETCNNCLFGVIFILYSVQFSSTILIRFNVHCVVPVAEYLQGQSVGHFRTIMHEQHSSQYRLFINCGPSIVPSYHVFSLLNWQVILIDNHCVILQSLVHFNLYKILYRYFRLFITVKF